MWRRLVAAPLRASLRAPTLRPRLLGQPRIQLFSSKTEDLKRQAAKLSDKIDDTLDQQGATLNDAYDKTNIDSTLSKAGEALKKAEAKVEDLGDKAEEAVTKGSQSAKKAASKVVAETADSGGFLGLLGREYGHLKEHLTKQRGPVRHRTVYRHVDDLEAVDWSKAAVEDSKTQAELDADARAEEDAEIAKAMAKMGEPMPEKKKEEMEEEAEEEEYTAGNSVQAVEGATTVWEDRIESFKDQFKSSKLFLGARQAKRADNVVANRLRDAKEDFEDKYDDFQDQLETTQNPLVWKLRDTGDAVFRETELAWATGKMLEKDPTFNMLEFVDHMKDYQIPTFVKALLEGNQDVLTCMTEGQALNFVQQHLKQRITQGHFVDTQILDVDHVDVQAIIVIDHEPLIKLSFVVQQINCVKNKKGEIVEGYESDVKQVAYVFLMRRDFHSKHFDWRLREVAFDVMMSLGV